MASRIVKQTRCMDALSLLARDGEAVFFTLTTEDVVDLHEIRRRWRGLRNWLVRRLGNPHYVMNFEKHPGYLQKVVKDERGRERIVRGDGISHGWHIHSVFSRFIPLRELQSQINAHGFGRVDVRRVTSKGITDYLTKHALKAYRGLSRKEREQYPKGRLRLVNTSRGLPRLCDYRWTSPELELHRKLFREYSDMRKSQGHKPEARKWLLRCSILSLLGASSFTDWNDFWMGLVDGHYAKAAKVPGDGAIEPPSNPRPFERFAVCDYEGRVLPTATKRKRTRPRKFCLPCNNLSHKIFDHSIVTQTGNKKVKKNLSEITTTFS